MATNNTSAESGAPEKPKNFPIPEFVNDGETPGDVNLVSAIATFC